MQALCVHASIWGKGCREPSSYTGSSFSFPTGTELSPGFIPIFHSLQIFAFPQILLTCPAFVFPSIVNALKYPLDKAFPLWFHLLQMLLTMHCLSKGIQFNWDPSWVNHWRPAGQPCKASSLLQVWVSCCYLPIFLHFGSSLFLSLFVIESATALLREV